MIDKILIVVLFIAMTWCGSLGGLGFKLVHNRPLKCFKDLFTNYGLIFGGFFYALAAVLNIYLFKYIDYVILLPMTAITYIWTMLIAHFFLHERINLYKVSGLTLIILGIIGLVYFKSPAQETAPQPQQQVEFHTAELDN